MTGVDISYAQASWPAGSWEFVCIQATHDSRGVDKLFAQHWAEARAYGVPRVGVYHYANPQASSGADQANLMADTALAAGYVRGRHFFALDFEEHPLSTPGENAAWVAAFMATARARLGDPRLFYVGWPFYVEHFGASHDLLAAHPWWLPAYGPNDGTEHPFDAGVPGELVVVHQYTSRGGPGGSGLDLNHVSNPAAFAAMFAPPAQPPAPTPPPTSTTTDHGDTPVKATEITMTLDAHGNGHVAVAGVKAADVFALIPVGIADPAVSHGYAPIPRLALTIGVDHLAEVVVVGGPTNGRTSVRVVHA